MKYHVYAMCVSVLFLAACGDKDNNRSVSGLTEEFGDKTIVHGFANLEHNAYISLNVNGSANLKDVKISQELHVNGSLKAEDCNLKDVTVHGSGSFEECKASGLVQVLGAALFEDCNLKNVEVTSMSVKFEECKVSSIVMKKHSLITSSSQQVVLNGTVVSGDVTFEQGNGIVVLKDGAKVKGKVVGGKIMKE